MDCDGTDNVEAPVALLRDIVLILPIHLILAIGIYFYNMEVCATKKW